MPETDSKKWILSRDFCKKRPNGLEDATIVLAGGRGVQSREDFNLLHEIAEIIGAAVGGSRAAAVHDCVDMDMLIGQTGCKIAPKLLIAAGISGATPFMTGVEKAQCIIAVNKDEFASIFNNCDLGLVGDYKAILNCLKEELS
jgi:electron transfer flavoprotein alpha subunit